MTTRKTALTRSMTCRHTSGRFASCRSLDFRFVEGATTALGHESCAAAQGIRDAAGPGADALAFGVDNFDAVLLHLKGQVSLLSPERLGPGGPLPGTVRLTTPMRLGAVLFLGWAYSVRASEVGFRVEHARGSPTRVFCDDPGRWIRKTCYLRKATKWGEIRKNR